MWACAPEQRKKHRRGADVVQNAQVRDPEARRVGAAGDVLAQNGGERKMMRIRESTRCDGPRQLAGLLD